MTICGEKYFNTFFLNYDLKIWSYSFEFYKSLFISIVQC